MDLPRRKMADQFEAAVRSLRWERWRYPAGQIKNLKTADPPIPAEHGVYVIRAPRPIPRVLGHSNVVYIGQSGGGKRAGKQGIGRGNGGPGRLFNTRGFEDIVRRKIEVLFSGTYLLECAFVADPGQVEANLLKKYFGTYCELPPANHNKGAWVNSRHAS